MTELALIAQDPSALEKAADPAAFVIQACERAKSWLAEVLEHGDIEQIVELKSQAEAIRIYTMSKQLGKDAELSASEIVRRAERCIGLAIRKGQAEGTIATRADNDRNLFPNGEKQRTAEFFGNHKEMSDTYAITDGVTDEEFETALKEAKAEQNLSRRNVVRKVKTAGTDEPKQAPKKDRRKRRPIVDAAQDAGWALRREIEKIERIVADDRFRDNKDKVAAHLHSHLTYALSTLPKLLERINPQGE